MRGENLLHADITDVIIRSAIEVHRELGPGLLESAYEICLADELLDAGMDVRKQVELPVRYKGRLLECGYRIDMIVNETVILELKCVERVLPIHESQLITYLRLSSKEVGLIINFNVAKIRDGIVRKVLSSPFHHSALSASPR